MIALGTDTDGHERLDKRRRYRWGYVGSLLAGIAAMFVAMRLGYPIVGIGLYWVGVAGMLGILWLTPINLFDEREAALHRRAAEMTLNLLGIAGVVAIPGAVILEEAGHLTITPLMNGLGLGFVGLYALLGVVTAILWLRK